jgi:hypothetical protein
MKHSDSRKQNTFQFSFTFQLVQGNILKNHKINLHLMTVTINFRSGLTRRCLVLPNIRVLHSQLKVDK